MTDINKQRFLAELGKLLTFMYEEDRQEALAMYSEMFDSGADEQSLLHQLVSPTRQAVVIARAYNQRERTLQTSARSRRDSYYEESMDDVPGYVIAIEDVRRQILGEREAARARQEELALFDTAEPVEKSVEVVEESSEETAVEEVEVQAAELTVVESSEAAEPVQEEAAAEESDEPAENSDAEELSEAQGLDEVLAVDEGEEAGQPEDQVEEESVLPAVQEPVEDTGYRHREYQQADEKRDHDRRGRRTAQRRGTYVQTERRARPLLLILYVLFAVPVGLVGGLVLLLPIMLFLALTIVAAWLGISAVSAAFGGFAMFSDLMVVLGGGLVLLALGLLFLWLFIWFIGGVLAGFINGLISIGGKLCYKEVEVE